MACAVQVAVMTSLEELTLLKYVDKEHIPNLSALTKLTVSLMTNNKHSPDVGGTISYRSFLTFSPMCL